mmetsp:Transcript_5749/g.9494  ORF Transcript_5749/g.9494 Transcript_5749/m.9494 type:complete len:181 (-) Transcript_5749:117-659(-)
MLRASTSKPLLGSRRAANPSDSRPHSRPRLLGLAHRLEPTLDGRLHRADCVHQNAPSLTQPRLRGSGKRCERELVHAVAKLDHVSPELPQQHVRVGRAGVHNGLVLAPQHLKLVAQLSDELLLGRCEWLWLRLRLGRCQRHRPSGPLWRSCLAGVPATVCRKRSVLFIACQTGELASLLL